MKNFSFAAWLWATCILFPGTATHASPSHYKPNSPSIALGVTTTHPAPTISPAHRVVAGGNLLHEDSAKMNFCLSDSELNSFRNQGISRSPNNPGLDLFGTFWGNAKKYEAKLKPTTFPASASSSPTRGVAELSVARVAGLEIADSRGVQPEDTLLYTLRGDQPVFFREL